MMQYNSENTDLEIRIQHVGLKKDIHQYNFRLDDKFFKNFENSIIQHADIHVKLVFDKRIEPYLIYLEIDGNVITDCDKCNAVFPLRIQSDNTIYVKFSGETVDDEQDTEIVFISRDEPEIDLSKIVYDIIHLDLPIYKVCNNPGKTEYCDQDVLKALNEYTNQNIEEEKIEDPRWAKLKDIKDELN
ncbi:MAG: DUF177 domain-containing protein [Sphingobacteriales bacterium]|jgi:uncharacterized metal-binding protein YceD (DUF177 family)|nr:MAG: DUF177 domain-containing protein [Sphingobacteriales bacterium]